MSVLKIRVVNEGTGSEWRTDLTGEVLGQYEAASPNGCFEMNGQSATHVLLYAEQDADMVASVIELVDVLADEETGARRHLANVPQGDIATGSKMMILSDADWEEFMSNRLLQPLVEADVSGIAVAIDSSDDEQKLTVAPTDIATGKVVCVQTQLRSKKPLMLVPLVGKNGPKTWKTGNTTAYDPYWKLTDANVRVNFNNLDGASRKIHAILFRCDTLAVTAAPTGSGAMFTVTTELDNVTLCEHRVRNSFFEYGGEMRKDSEYDADTRAMQNGSFIAVLRNRTFLYEVDTTIYDGYHGIVSDELDGVDMAQAAVLNSDETKAVAYPYPLAPDNEVDIADVSAKIIYVQPYSADAEVVFIGESSVAEDTAPDRVRYSPPT